MKQMMTWIRIGLLRLHGWWLILFNRLLRRKIQLLKNDLWHEESHPASSPRTDTGDAKKSVNPFQRTPRP
jgi:hypothetical protein